MLAAVGNTPYNIILFVHILLVLAAFAPAFVHPLIASQTKGMEGGARRAMFTAMAGNGRRVYAPALILTGLLGFALSGMSEGVYAMSQTWLIISAIIWIAMNGVLHAMILPGERAIAGGDDSGQGKVDTGGMIISVLLLVMLFLMVFKPGQ